MNAWRAVLVLMLFGGAAFAQKLPPFGLSADLVVPATPSTEKIAYAVGSDLSGAFYDPAQNGHGFIIQHIVSGGVPAVLVTWFTYLDGKTRWLIGIGPVTGNTARIPLVIGSGADFPPRFNPASATLQDWGELTLSFANKNGGTATWTTTFPGFSNGSMPITRLTQPASAFESPANAIAACHSGAWYDPAQSGHGVFIEVLGSAPSRTMLAIWYAYLNGEQRWMVATGPIVGNVANLTATLTAGATAAPNFNPAAVTSQPWGTMTFTAQGANDASWSWNSTIAGFGSGTMPLARLTELSGKGCGPSSDAEAARFLTQASFGPTTESVAQVRTLGYQGWIDAQLALAPTLQRPTLEAQVAAHVLVDGRGASFYNAFRVDRWFASTVAGPDQLRQRMAFALSQILVLSDVGALVANPMVVAEYNDILLRHAFGNYRDLLHDVTYNPGMGQFLTSLRNQKTDWTLDTSGNLVPGLLAPDENYAREVMQLFSIGLIERNRDYSPILVSGQPVPTYTQDLVTQTAKVLTGLSYACTGTQSVGGITIASRCNSNCTGTGCQFSTTAFFSTPPRYVVPGTPTGTALMHPDAYNPMICYPRYADTGRSATSANNYAVLPSPQDHKTLLAGISVNASPVACHSGTTGADQQTCIDYCNNQVDTLINSLYLHPNVAPFLARQLIQRMTTSNPSPGYIDRVAASFEDDGTGVRGNLGAVAKAILLDPEARTNVPAPTFGKLREPLLRLTAIWRAFGAQPSVNGYGSPDRGLSQRPLGADSVFNFYEPDYQQPGEIADAGLYSPEFQILNESTAITSSDELWRRVFSGYSTPNTTTTNFTTPTTSAYLPPSVIDALPSDHAALVEALNQKMMFGAMSAGMRGKLVALLNADLAAADSRRKALDLIHLIAISPEFALQQ